MSAHRAASMLLVLILAACSSTGSNNDPPLRRQSDLITAEEIAATAATTAYAAVEELRPAFLRARSQSVTPHTPIVYVNGQRWGDIESLRTIPASEVLTIRRLNAADAQSRYGPDHIGGVLDIVSKRGRGAS